MTRRALSFLRSTWSSNNSRCPRAILLGCTVLADCLLDCVGESTSITSDHLLHVCWAVSSQMALNFGAIITSTSSSSSSTVKSLWAILCSCVHICPCHCFLVANVSFWTSVAFRDINQSESTAISTARTGHRATCSEYSTWGSRVSTGWTSVSLRTELLDHGLEIGAGQDGCFWVGILSAVVTSRTRLSVNFSLPVVAPCTRGTCRSIALPAKETTITDSGCRRNDILGSCLFPLVAISDFSKQRVSGLVVVRGSVPGVLINFSARC